MKYLLKGWRQMTRQKVICLSFLLGFLLVATPGQTESLDVVVERVQRHLDEIRDFEARFTQRYHRQLLGKLIVESGVVQIKKPGRMRWDYLHPEEKLFVTNGSKTYFYVPEEKQVIVSNTPSGALGLTPDSPLSLLAGQSRLSDAFEVTESDHRPEAGGSMLRLVPKRREEDIENVELEVETDTGRFRRVILVNSQENRTEFLFEDIKENQDLPEMLFLFTVPPGVDIVIAEPSARAPLHQKSRWDHPETRVPGHQRERSENPTSEERDGR